MSVPLLRPVPEPEPDTLILPADGWRHLLGLTPKRPTRVKMMTLNALPNGRGGLHKWLHRGDVLRLLYAEAERLENRDLRLLADRINETTKEN